jgi:hypothetical protein
MKERLLLLIALSVAPGAFAGPLTLESAAVVPGTASQGGPYLLLSAAAEPVAGPSAFAPFSLWTGFPLELAVVETPGVPGLQINLTLEGRVAIAWESDSQAFALEAADRLGEGRWRALDLVPNVQNRLHVVLLAPDAPTQFFRLRSH